MTKEKNVFIKNIFHMLSYAFQGLSQRDEERIETEEFQNTADLLCAILSICTVHLLRKGLHREFVSIEESLPTMRGKINMAATIGEFSKQNRVLCCEHDEFSEDNKFNRIILCTLLLLAKSGEVKKQRKDETRRLVPYFANVKRINPSEIRWNDLSYSQNNKDYKFAMNICYFALNALLPTTEVGDYRVRGISNDEAIHRLYEKFVLEYFRKEHPDLNANPSEVEWNLDKGEEILQLPKMITDITLFHDGKALIIDAKFYGRELARHNDKDIFHSANLYQIFSYVKNKDRARDGSVSGILLYAKTDKDLNVSETPFHIDGNEFRVMQLDLNQPFSFIRERLDSIAKEMLER